MFFEAIVMVEIGSPVSDHGVPRDAVNVFERHAWKVLDNVGTPEIRPLGIPKKVRKCVYEFRVHVLANTADEAKAKLSDAFSDITGPEEAGVTWDMVN